MKKLLLVTLLLMLTGIFHASAQKGFNIGVGGNVNAIFILSQNTYGLDELDYKPSIGGAINLGIGYNFNNWLGLKTEIGYARLGQKYYDNRNNPVITRDVRLNYILVPLLVRFSVGGHVFRFYAAAGPQLAFLTSASQDYLKNGVPLPPFYNRQIKDTINPSQTNITDRYQKIDIMARLDFGLDVIFFQHLALNFGISSAYGFADINASDWRLENSKGSYSKSTNLYAGLTLGLRYSFGGFGK